MFMRGFKNIGAKIMKKKFIIAISFFCVLLFSSDSLEAHPLSWLYDSGKEYLSNVSDVDFWKGACCVVVGLFAVEKCAPLAKKTFRFIFRMPKEETEVEKVTNELNTLKAQLNPQQPSPRISEEEIQKLFQEWIGKQYAEELPSMIQMQKNLDVCSNGLIRLCNCYKKSSVRMDSIDKKLSNILKHLDKNNDISTSSSSEEDDSEEFARRKPKHGLNLQQVPRINFQDLHRRITSPTSPNRGYFSSGGSNDASDESSSSSEEDDDDGSPATITPKSLSRSSDDSTPRKSFESDSIVIRNTDSESDHDYEPLIDDEGNHEGYKKSPRPTSYNEKALSRALGSDNLRSSKTPPSGSPLKRTEKKLSKMSSSVVLPKKKKSQSIRPRSLEEPVNKRFVEKLIEEPSDYIVTEENEQVPFSWQAPTTPIGMAQLEESEVSPVIIVGDQENHDVALQRYYADKPKNTPKGKDCRIV